MNIKQELDQPSETDLTASFDKSVNTAVALGLSEQQLVSLFSQRLHELTTDIAHQPNSDLPRRMYNPDAGP